MQPLLTELIAARGHKLPVVLCVIAATRGCGINVCLRDKASEIQEVPVEDTGILTDLDTPDDDNHLGRAVANLNVLR